jgi:hypothetical protein
MIDKKQYTTLIAYCGFKRWSGLRFSGNTGRKIWNDLL